MFRKFRLSDGGKEKHNSGEVISTGFKHLSNDLDTFDANITESSQNSSPEPATNRVLLCVLGLGRKIDGMLKR